MSPQASYAQVHAAMSPDWWTPPEWMQWVRASLRVHVDTELFDPCPRDWTAGMPSGLAVPWDRGPTYVNHPGARRGAAPEWWLKAVAEGAVYRSLVWCAFSVDQLRHLDPSPLSLGGYLVMPRTRIGFIWGGPDMYRDGQLVRRHGEQCRSPGNWTVFWSTHAPAPTPEPSVIMPTGEAWEL